MNPDLVKLSQSLEGIRQHEIPHRDYLINFLRSVCSESVFIETNTGWYIGDAHGRHTFKKSLGMRYIFTLLETPLIEQHCLFLKDPQFSDMALAEPGDHSTLGTDPVIDRGAYQAITERLELIDESLLTCGGEEHESLQEEQDELIRYLQEGGRSFIDPQEKARSSVTHSIDRAIEQIEKHLPAIGDHLRTSIKTGTLCCYSPKEIIRWNLKNVTNQAFLSRLVNSKD